MSLPDFSGHFHVGREVFVPKGAAYLLLKNLTFT